MLGGEGVEPSLVDGEEGEDLVRDRSHGEARLAQQLAQDAPAFDRLAGRWVDVQPDAREGLERLETPISMRMLRATARITGGCAAPPMRDTRRPPRARDARESLLFGCGGALAPAVQSRTIFGCTKRSKSR